MIFDNDRHELLMSMEENGVGGIVEAGADVKSSDNAIELSGKYSFVYAAAGIHPQETAGIDESHMEWLEAQASKEKVVAEEMVYTAAGNCKGYRSSCGYT